VLGDLHPTLKQCCSRSFLHSNFRAERYRNSHHYVNPNGTQDQKIRDPEPQHLGSIVGRKSIRNPRVQALRSRARSRMFGRRCSWRVLFGHHDQWLRAFHRLFKYQHYERRDSRGLQQRLTKQFCLPLPGTGIPHAVTYLKTNINISGPQLFKFGCDIQIRW